MRGDPRGLIELMEMIKSAEELSRVEVVETVIILDDADK